MADKNPHEEQLAVAVHAAELRVARANQAPAGPRRIDEINKADRQLSKAQQELDHYLSEQGSPMIPVDR
jgi:hypothetical protein